MNYCYLLILLILFGYAHLVANFTEGNHTSGCAWWKLLLVSTIVVYLLNNDSLWHSHLELRELFGTIAFVLWIVSRVLMLLVRRIEAIWIYRHMNCRFLPSSLLVVLAQQMVIPTDAWTCDHLCLQELNLILKLQDLNVHLVVCLARRFFRSEDCLNHIIVPSCDLIEGLFTVWALMDRLLGWVQIRVQSCPFLYNYIGGSLAVWLLIPGHRWRYCAWVELILPLVNQTGRLLLLDSAASSVVNLLEDVWELGCTIHVERGAIRAQRLVLCIMFLEKVLSMWAQGLRLVGLCTGYLLLLSLVRYESLIITSGRRVHRVSPNGAIVKAELFMWYLTLPSRLLLFPEMHSFVFDVFRGRCWTLPPLALLAISTMSISRLLRRLVQARMHWILWLQLFEVHHYWNSVWVCGDWFSQIFCDYIIIPAEYFSWLCFFHTWVDLIQFLKAQFCLAKWWLTPASIHCLIYLNRAISLLNNCRLLVWRARIWVLSWKGLAIVATTWASLNSIELSRGISFDFIEPLC